MSLTAPRPRDAPRAPARGLDDFSSFYAANAERVLVFLTRRCLDPALALDLIRVLETSSARSRRVVVLRQRRIAVLAVVIAMVSVGSVGAATGLIPVGTQHESPARDSGDSLHTVVASGSSPVAGKWRVESYRGGPVTGPTGQVARPAGARCLALLIGGKAPDFAGGSSICGGKLATDAFGYSSNPIRDKQSGRNELLLYGWAPAGTETVQLSGPGGLDLSARTQGPRNVKQRYWVISAPPLPSGGRLTTTGPGGTVGDSIKVIPTPLARFESRTG